MFCPRCSHQQVSDSARYCTKCGFQISAIKELVANDGVPTAAAPTGCLTADDSIDRRIRKRGKMLNIVLMVAVVSLISNLHNHGEFLPKSIVIGILMAILVARIVVKAKGSINYTSTQSVPANDATFTPAQNQQPKRIVTAEMVPVPSVTEGTTKLLVDQPRNFE